MRHKFTRFLFIIFFIFLSFIAANCSAASLTEWEYCSTDKLDLADSSLVQLRAQPDLKWLPYNPAKDFTQHTNSLSWYTAKISTDNKHDNTLLFSTAGQAVKVWLDNKLIYAFGKIHSPWQDAGARWHMVYIPEPADSNSTLLIELYTPFPQEIEPFHYLTFGSEAAATRELFIYDAINITVLPIAGCIIFLMAIFYHENYIKKGFCLLVITFLLVLSTWLFTATNSKFFIYDNPLFWYYFQNLLVYSMPIIGNFILANTITGFGKKFAKAVSALFLLLFITVSIGEIAGTHTFIRFLKYYHLMILLLEPIVWYFTIQAARHGNIYAKTLLVPILIHAFTGLLDSLFPYIQFWGHRFFLAPLAIYGFIYLIVVISHQQVKQDAVIFSNTSKIKLKLMQIVHKASLDPLTKCLNRTSFTKLLAGACKDASLSGKPFSLIMCDIDFFKRFNDRYGHDIGDAVIKAFITKIRESIDTQPIIRWGGEEFVIICPQTNLEHAVHLAEKIRKNINTLYIKEPVTASFGVAVYHLNDADDTTSKLFQRVDKALYLAKQSGRNQTKSEYNLLEK